VLTYTRFLQPTILIDNVNQFKVGLETDNGLKGQDSDGVLLLLIEPSPSKISVF
jgi:hypothetical protein